MEGKKFSCFSKNYLRKRPRYSPTSIADDQTPSTSTCMPSTSSASTRRTQVQRILIEPSDEQLLKWQEEQISQCIVDNTLNRVVDSCAIFRDEENPGGAGARNELEREAQLASYHARRAQENFEDSAILWAIEQYGLQQHTHHLFNDNRAETMSTSSSSISLSSPPHLPSQDDPYNFMGSEHVSQETNKDDANKTSTESNFFGESSKQKQNQDYAYTAAQQPIATSNQPHNSAGQEVIDNEHFDFMEAAVSVAIQEKGLISYSMQKSPKR